MSVFQAREGQAAVLAYTGGRMGISAVPGSGKTRTLAELAAMLVAGRIDGVQEVLIVTLVNAAVDNFRQRIDASIKRHGLLAGFGYRVRTLHGLAHDIVRERPGLVGLSDDFGIIDEREARLVREDAVDVWLKSHPELADAFLRIDFDENYADQLRRNQWRELIRDVAEAFVKRAKDLQLSPEAVQARLDEAGKHLDNPSAPWIQLATMGSAVYTRYQKSLSYRGVVDFDDLIRLALDAFERDQDYLARLRQRWPYILEDEAQDSSLAQEKILKGLVGLHGNWVRVGDSNQAIYQTFTTADPGLLREFIIQDDVHRVSLPQSGRSQQAIIDMANHLVDWALTDHPSPAIQSALNSQSDQIVPFTSLHIIPTDLGDPQPNPPTLFGKVKLIGKEFTPNAELHAVAQMLVRWHRDQQTRAARGEPQQTCAVLTPRSNKGSHLAQLLTAEDIPFVELLRSSTQTRHTAGALGNLLRCLADPTNARKLSVAFRVWLRRTRGEPEEPSLADDVENRIVGCNAVEAYLWPRADHDWIASFDGQLANSELDLLLEFRDVARRWHKAAALPIDQLVLTLAGNLFQEKSELALAHKLAQLLRDVSQSHPDHRLPELVEELATIARNERRFLGFAREEMNFEPPKGKVTIATMHKAKGLEWDCVYLLSVNNFDFPSDQAHDKYQDEKWFIRDGLNLKAESLAGLEALSHKDLKDARRFSEGKASNQARIEYVAERLRLLYVGITRARETLTITWNTGASRDGKQQPAAPFIELETFWVAKQK